jgi:hypothetical protein
MDLSQLQNKTSLLYDVKGVLGDNVDGRFSFLLNNNTLNYEKE